MEQTNLLMLIINLGATSSKIAAYRDSTRLFIETIRHDVDELNQFSDIWQQCDYRRQAVLGSVARHGLQMSRFNAVVSRGGLTRPMPAGVYAIDAALLADARSGVYGVHACNVGCQITFDFSQELGIPGITVDPPTCDDLCDEARYSGIPGLNRRSVYHALNQRAIGRAVARDLGKPYDRIDAIIAHMGGGISVGVHARGRVIDVNNAVDGDGPFSTDRAGSLPAGDLARLCFSGRYTLEQTLKLITGKGGLLAHVGTTDGVALEKRIAAGDDQARRVVEAMAYQVAKEIGAAATVLAGRVDAIALTGGLAYWDRLVELVSRRVAFIAPIRLYPGEDEISALAESALAVLRGKVAEKSYA